MYTTNMTYDNHEDVITAQLRELHDKAYIKSLENNSMEFDPDDPGTWDLVI